MAGELLPGQRLTEAELSKQLGTSRAPIREALRQLEQEGLVASYPYRGTEVLGVSQEEIEEVLVPIRITLERFAFSKAMSRLTEDDYTQLETLVQDMARAAEAKDFDTLAESDIRFHETVIAASDQRHCLQMWRTIQPRVRAYFRRDATTYVDHLAVAAQHEVLITALRAGDQDVVTAEIEAHIKIHAHPAGTRTHA